MSLSEIPVDDVIAPASEIWTLFAFNAVRDELDPLPNATPPSADTLA